MLFYLFGVTGIHEQYYIYDRVKPLYYFPKSQSHSRYVFFLIFVKIFNNHWNTTKIIAL